ncbi:FAD-binding oxidoreductase [Holophaga foetida]|uniref:FAD-binding oxidoreductase n=1 Tax=Holophaga foetida TaxID=35839 RepID=UPI0002474CF9|nr:FAD-linked oxidase C-terminal domain-containing protein [Holophaga foetida]
MKPETRLALIHIVGPEHVLEAREDLLCYAYDASPIAMDPAHLPCMVLFPANAEEVSRIVGLANDAGFVIYPRGAGSNVSGGSIPDRDAVVMVLSRMNRILEIDQANMTADLEPGVITEQFQTAVEKLGLFYPPDPSSKAFSTMGGNVAECAGGPRGAKYGVTRDYVLALEVVMPTGEIIHTGARTMKSVAGLDLTRLMVGSEGTLGIITRITVRLLALPAAKKTLMAIFPDLEKPSQTVAKIFTAGMVPTTMELLDKTFINAIEDYRQIGLPREAEAILLIEVDGEAESVDRQADRIAEICHQQGATRTQVAKDAAEAEELWIARRSAFASVCRIKPNIIGEDATVPRAAIPQAVREVQAIAARHNLTIGVMGHAGDGNLHPSILADERDADEMRRVELAVEEIFRSFLALRGTLSGEHGIGRMKSRFLHLETGEAGLKVMRSIKRALDPNNILNPTIGLGA